MSRIKTTICVFLAATAGPPACYIFVAFLFAALAGGWGKEAATGDIEVYVRGDAVHAEFVFPINNRIMDWSSLMLATDFRSPPVVASHVSLGWGERDFYLRTPRWMNFDLAVGLKAVAYSEKTVLHVYRLASPRGYSWHRRLELSETQYRDLVDYVLSSLRLTNNMPVVLEGEGYGPNDAFYEAEGTYSPFMTCNEWVNRGLRSAGLNSALWSPFSFGVKWALPKQPPGGPVPRTVSPPSGPPGRAY